MRPSSTVPTGWTGRGHDAHALATTTPIVARKGSTSWASITPSAPTSMSRTITNQTVFGQYAIGEPYAAATNPPLTKTAGSAAAAVGSYVTFVVTAKNPYAFDLSNVVVADAIPAGMTPYLHPRCHPRGGAAFGAGAELGDPPVVAGGSAQLTLVLLAGQRGSSPTRFIRRAPRRRARRS